jgi:hypothetical protein
MADIMHLFAPVDGELKTDNVDGPQQLPQPQTPLPFVGIVGKL